MVEDSEQVDDTTPDDPVRVHDETLHQWQRDAVTSWEQGDGHGQHRGTLEIFTGGGKTLIALSAFGRVSSAVPEVKLAVVVPTEALARQWEANLIERTSLEAADIGMLGAGRSDRLEDHRALVAVINSAAKHLPAMATNSTPLMLVVDECHRAGARTFARVLQTPARYRLGLSATPDREEVDEQGLPLEYDEHLLGQLLGKVVYRFSLKDARRIGWLPEYKIHHHGVSLLPDEQVQYERTSRRVSDLADSLQAYGVQSGQARFAATKGGEVGQVASAYIAAVARRKDLLYRAEERERIAVRIVAKAATRERTPRILLFHERVVEATRLYERLCAALPELRIALEHSQLPTLQRQEAIRAFRSGEVRVLVSVKSLVEGIDVPEADVGVSVASSSSVRQRVQSLGRVLRRSFDGSEDKQADMHVIYAAETVDEAIYAKEDWSDLTGEDANRYWLWPTDAEATPVEQAGPPQEPRPTEDQVWEQLDRRVPADPVVWPGVMPELEYSVDTRANVTTSQGAVVANPQGVAEMVRRVRGREGGRFRVSPLYRLVLVWGDGEAGRAPYLAGQLEEPFRIRQDSPSDPDDAETDVSSLASGDEYPGPTDDEHGTFALRAKRGGVIERRVGSDREFAFTDGDTNHEKNARTALAAWRSLGLPGMEFKINSLGHAWYLDQGVPRFLADVQGGFTWPGEELATDP